MKKEILTLIAAAAIAQSAFAQENKTIVAMNEEKIPAYTINLGANLAATGDGNIIGINLKINKTIKPKLLLGLSSDIGRMSKKGYTTGNSLGNVTQTDNLGFCEGLFITTTYYFMGNSSNSKNGMYLRFGLGAVNYTLKYKSTSVGSDYIDAISVSNLSFSGEMCFGADFKLGKGKLFAELVSTPVLTGNSLVTFNTTNSSGTLTFSESNRRHITAKNVEGLLGARFGYTFNF